MKKWSRPDRRKIFIALKTKRGIGYIKGTTKNVSRETDGGKISEPL
jgi:hypothetical protein